MKSFVRFTLLAVLFGTSISQAQVRPDPRPYDPVDQKVRELENRVRRMEDNYRRLDFRLSILEQGGGYPQPVPPPDQPVRMDFSCMVVDTGYTKTFYARGATQLQAETNARIECGKSVNAAYCNAAIRCSTGLSEPGYRGYFCTIQDSGYSKIFTGEGADAIEAEAKAKISCQQSVNAAYCGNVRAKCEGIRQ